MYNGNANGGYQPNVALDPPEEQYPDRDDDAYTGGLAAQDISAQHYTVNIPGDDQLTYGEGRTYQHSTSFADYPPHTLVSIKHALHAIAIPGRTPVQIAICRATTMLFTLLYGQIRNCRAIADEQLAYIHAQQHHCVQSLSQHAHAALHTLHHR